MQNLDSKNTKLRILIIRIGALGDVLHTLPMLDALRKHYPSAHIGWLVSKAARPLLEHHPMIDSLHTFEGLKRNKWRELKACIAELKAQQYDIAIDTQGLFKSGLMAWLSGAPTRLGLQNARELAPLFYTQRVDTGPLKAPDKVVWQHYLELLAPLDPKITHRTETPAFPLAPTKSPLANDLFPKHTQLIGLAPITAWTSKNWPVAHWQTLIEKIITNSSAHICLFGGPNEASQLATLQANSSQPERLHIPNLPLAELPAAIKQLSVLIGGDSFPLHLAGTLGINVLGLYGPTSEKRTPPPKTTGKQTLLVQAPPLSCQPCHKKSCSIKTHDCLNTLSPLQVWEHLQPLLSE